MEWVLSMSPTKIVCRASRTAKGLLGNGRILTGSGRPRPGSEGAAAGVELPEDIARRPDPNREAARVGSRVGRSLMRAAFHFAGDQEGQLHRLLVVQAGIHLALVGAGQVALTGAAGAAHALGHILSRQLHMHAAELLVHLGVNIEGLFHLGVDILEGARLDAVGQGVGVFLVDDYYAGGDAGAIKEVGRQADDALDIALADKGSADVGLGVAAEEDAVRENACADRKSVV